MDTMTAEYKWWRIQMFADGGGDGAGDGGGADGGASDTGGTAPDAGEATLRALGATEAGIQKWAKRNRKLSANAAAQANTEAARQQTEPGVATQANAPAEAQTEAPAEQVAEAPAKKTLRQIMDEDPELRAQYDTEMQAAIKGRLRASKNAEENLKTLEPALMMLAQGYGMDLEKLDYKALVNAINTDDRLVEDSALRNGNSLAEQRRQNEEAVNAVIQRRTEMERANQEHVMEIARQAAEYAKKNPNFDLQAELQNAAFQRMTSPYGGATVEMAYNAIHHDELQRQAVSRAQEAARTQTVNAIRSGAARPAEVGSRSGTAGDMQIDFGRLTHGQLAAIREQSKQAAARGQHLRLEDIKF